jgi:hypothetical protein
VETVVQDWDNFFTSVRKPGEQQSDFMEQIVTIQVQELLLSSGRCLKALEIVSLRAGSSE